MQTIVHILLYMFFLNKRSNFEKKPHELSYRSNIYINKYQFYKYVEEYSDRNKVLLFIY